MIIDEIQTLLEVDRSLFGHAGKAVCGDPYTFEFLEFLEEFLENQGSQGGQGGNGTSGGYKRETFVAFFIGNYISLLCARTFLFGY